MGAAAAAGAAAAVVVADVLDTLGGAFALTRASPTLDGSIPLRAAQACTPFLEGNRAGLQLSLRHRLELRTSLGGVTLLAPPEPLVRAHKGSAPRYSAEGLLPPDSAWRRPIERRLLWRGGRGSRVSLFTGLFVRPRAGVVLRVGDAGNRRNVLFEVEERWIADSKRFVPLVLSLVLGKDAEQPLALHGELATLMAFDPRVRLARKQLREAKEIGQAHFAFYDQRYFEQKKRAATKKYKRMLAQAKDGTAKPEGRLEMVLAGPESIREADSATFVTPEGCERRATPVPHFVFDNALPFSARFDGHDTVVEPERAALKRFAETTRETWARSFDAETLEAHPGALWYFTKYVTPHQAGEPYFFLKPPALFETSPGWSTLVEGIPGPGYEVLRGIVATDRFHALPAVFRLGFPGRKVAVKAGAPLARFLPVPRRLLDMDVEQLEWGYA